jgi:hypothetical protein
VCCFCLLCHLVESCYLLVQCGVHLLQVLCDPPRQLMPTCLSMQHTMALSLLLLPVMVEHKMEACHGLPVPLLLLMPLPLLLLLHDCCLNPRGDVAQQRTWLWWLAQHWQVQQLEAMLAVASLHEHGQGRGVWGVCTRCSGLRWQHLRAAGPTGLTMQQTPLLTRSQAHTHVLVPTTQLACSHTTQGDLGDTQDMAAVAGGTSVVTLCTTCTTCC